MMHVVHTPKLAFALCGACHWRSAIFERTQPCHTEAKLAGWAFVQLVEHSLCCPKRSISERR